MKKEYALLFGFAISIILVFAFVSAANETNSTTILNTASNSDDSGKVDKAYQCITDLVSNKTSSSLSLQEAIFATLALGSRDTLISKISSQGNNCWPSSSCTIRDTSQVLMAYNSIGKDTSQIEKWIFSKNGTVKDLNWYLEIDATDHQSTTCTVSYDSNQNQITIKEDMTVEGSGSCIESNGYWLRIDSSCLNKQFRISCKDDFVTTLLYQKAGDTTKYYVIPQTHSAASDGTTTEKINAQCFGNGNSCDYEGSLWATLALNMLGKDISPYTPYLLALAEDNQKYFPNAFLYFLTGDEQSFSSVSQSQIKNQYWQIADSPYNKYYDTSLALLALSKSGKTERQNAINYLLQVQTPEGCWNNNNLKDTAFLLYAGWPRANSGGSSGGLGSGLCSSAGYFCEYRFSCIDSGGKIVDNLACPGGQLGCCSIKVPELSCSAQGGKICSSNEQCGGSVVSSSDSGICCQSECNPIQTQDMCTLSNGICQSSCDSNQEEFSYSCSTSGQVCCINKTETKSGSSLWIWIILLMVLILIVVLAILYRDKIKIWWFKTRGKVKTTPVTRSREPGYSPQPIRGFGGPRPPFGSAPATVRRPSTNARKDSEKDKEMEETLRKLREIGK